MITKLEIDGFKTFRNFNLTLGPFQVIVGPNGVGKSNLFDALRLLSLLADGELHTAFGALRGEAKDLFSVRPDGSIVHHMTFAVEILVERKVKDSWGAEAELSYPRLRYELAIVRRADEFGLERLYVTNEQLLPISEGDDPWFDRFIGHTTTRWRPQPGHERTQPFISTDSTGDQTLIRVHQDEHSRNKANIADQVERTILSGIISAEFPHCFAAREEMRSWRLLQLSSEVLRQASSMLAHPIIGLDGSNLPTTLARIEAEDRFILNDISRDLASVAPGIVKVDIERDQAQSRNTIRAYMQDGQIFSSHVLSDGALRMLALITLKHDPEHHGVLMIEEPEIGVHSYRVKNMAKNLYDLATDFKDNQSEFPIRQVIITTHSPVLVKEVVNMLHGDFGVLYAYMPLSVHPKADEQASRSTKIVPISAKLQENVYPFIDANEERWTYQQVINYLDTGDSSDAIDQLRAARIVA